MPIPRGIYNELRSVGIALPMYRPPVVMYDEGAYFSETIDGLVLARTFLADRPWSIEANLYAGGWRSRGTAARFAVMASAKRASVADMAPRASMISISWKRPRLAIARASASASWRRVATRSPTPRTWVACG